MNSATNFTIETGSSLVIGGDITLALVASLMNPTETASGIPMVSSPLKQTVPPSTSRLVSNVVLIVRVYEKIDVRNYHWRIFSK